MENQYSDEQLDAMLGTKQVQFEKFRTINVDNGTDIAGTGATGEFIEKRYNPETKATERIPFAPDFEGVILASKAMLIDKMKVPTWMTGEFDPSDVTAQVEVLPLQGGKFIKDANGVVKKAFATYKEIKAKRRMQQPDGSYQSTYNYFIILYVSVGEEIIKLKFKGSSRGNFFDYSKSVNSIGAKIYNVYTVFTTYMDNKTGKYAIDFSTKVDAKGNPVSVDIEAIRNQRVKMAKSFMALAERRLAGPSTKQINQPETPRPSPDNSEVKPHEIIGSEEEEINIKDVPFD